MSDGGEASGDTLTLQRGGEEMLLRRVDDRFTTRLVRPDALDAVRSQVAPLAVRPVARGQLVEWQVEASRLEACLALVRRHPGVLFASHVYQPVSSPRTWIYLTDQVTVQFEPGVSGTRRGAIVDPHGLVDPSGLEGIPNTFVYRVSAAAQENPVKIANRLMAFEEVLTAEPNVVMAMAQLYRPQDDLYGRQWHLTSVVATHVKPNAHISVEGAWDMTRGARSVVIAVSDDGFDLDHPDLQGMGKIVAPLDLRAQDAVPLPTNREENHGTACAGLAIGEENNQGIVGVAPGCGFMPIRTTGFLDDESIEGIFRWAVEKGAAVISCSWSPAAIQFPLSLRQRNALTQAAMRGRDGKGCVIVFSAGNTNRPVSGTVNETGWPRNAVKGLTDWLSGFAVHPDVIAVSACTSLNTKALYSSWGKHIAIAAPSNNAHPSILLPETGSIKTGPVTDVALAGRGMVTSDRVGALGYDQSAYTQTFGGTSSACPEVAGVAGLVLSMNPTLTAREVKQILQQTADKIVDSQPDPQLGNQFGTYDTNGHSQWFGYGRVNAERAVQEAQRRLWQGRTYTGKVDLVNDAPGEIPDNDVEGLVRSLQCRESGTVQDLALVVEVEHAFLSDVTLHLEPPVGTALLLQGRTLGTQQRLEKRYDLTNTPMLVQCVGMAAAGRWQVRIRDHAPQHVGRFVRCQLTLALE